MPAHCTVALARSWALRHVSPPLPTPLTGGDPSIPLGGGLHSIEAGDLHAHALNSGPASLLSQYDILSLQHFAGPSQFHHIWHIGQSPTTPHQAKPFSQASRRITRRLTRRITRRMVKILEDTCNLKPLACFKPLGWTPLSNSAPTPKCFAPFNNISNGPDRYFNGPDRYF